MKRLVWLAAVGIGLSAFPAAAQSVLWGSSAFENKYFSIDQATAAALTTQPVVLAGFTVNGINSLTRDPSTGLIYIIAKTQSNGRQLATLNLATGVATLVGALGDNFSTLAFNSSG